MARLPRLMRIGRPCCLMALVLAAAILARLALRGPDNDRVSAPHDEPHATGDTRPAAVAVTRSSGEQGCAPCDGAATHAPSERRTCVFGSEVFGDVSYDCSSNFDPLFYRRLHSESALAFLDDSALERHYSDFGVLAGHRGHSGQRTMKIILMTRDDWPLIRSWVLYHADVFGGENLYGALTSGSCASCGTPRASLECTTSALTQTSTGLAPKSKRLR